MTLHVFKPAALCAGLALASAQAVAADGARTAADFGCLNCHGDQSRSAPTLKQMAERAVRRGDSPETLQRLLDEMREKDAVRTHVMVSDEAARVVLQWVARGMK